MEILRQTLQPLNHKDIPNGELLLSKPFFPQCADNADRAQQLVVAGFSSYLYMHSTPS